MRTKAHFGWLTILTLISAAAAAAAAEPVAPPASTVRVAAAQASGRVIDFRLKPDEALAAVGKNLAELEHIVNRAGEAKCDALVLPEDTPGLLNWMGANEPLAKEVLPQAVNRMLERLGSAAARHKMYLVAATSSKAMARLTTRPSCSAAMARRLAAITKSVRHGRKQACGSGEIRSRSFPRLIWARPGC